MPLIRDALNVADGYLRGILEVQHRITAAQQLIGGAGADHPELDLGPATVHLPQHPQRVRRQGAPAGGPERNARVWITYRPVTGSALRAPGPR
ncbi:hypothetical protein AB0I81_33535 [Nonomuraea sp. NPDC050404]|uniref:hypothetical protein n=1 Tax=Nonomuraea sp. NPDC050404 TaxID=3155783 RepID=UPI0033E74461